MEAVLFGGFKPMPAFKAEVHLCSPGGTYQPTGEHMALRRLPSRQCDIHVEPLSILVMSHNPLQCANASRTCAPRGIEAEAVAGVLDWK